jgi:hypothetical protein
MCHGLNNEDDNDLVDFKKDPWTLLKVLTYPPNLVRWRNEIIRRARINIATKQSTKLSKKDSFAQPVHDYKMSEVAQNIRNYYPI